MRLAVLLALSGTAYADLPTIESENPPTLRVTSGSWNARIDRVALAIHSAPETTWLTITMSGGRRDRVIELDVPEGTRVLGMGVANDVANAWGQPLPIGDARERINDGAAFLKWDGASVGQEHLIITLDRPSTVDLALQLPPLARLAVDVDGGATSVSIGDEPRFAAKGRHQRTVLDLDDVSGRIDAPPTVREGVAITAAQSPANMFFQAVDMRPRGIRDLDKAMIRRRMQMHRAQLRECFQHWAQFQWTLEGAGETVGGVIVSFRVQPDGSVADVHTIESDLPAQVNECLVAEVTSWEFPETDTPVEVHYPLEFRLW